MRKLAAILLFFATVAAALAADSRYELNINEFAELKVIEGLNVNYKSLPDSAGKAVFTTSKDLASVLMFSNNKGKLTIQIATDGIDYQNLPTITVYSSYLRTVENSGDSTVRVLKVAPGADFNAKLFGNGALIVDDLHMTKASLKFGAGNGTLTATGAVENLTINFGGTGTIQADGLEAQKINIRAAGTGAIGCYPVKDLKVYGIGSTSIYYKGKPEITNRSAGLKLIELE